MPPPHDQSRRSKLAQMPGDWVQIQLWFGSRSHAWLHVGPGLLDRMQPPGLRRAPFPSAASPRSPHTCVRLRRWPAGPHPAPPGAWSPAGSSHFIFPAVPGARQPPQPLCGPFTGAGSPPSTVALGPIRAPAEAVKLVTTVSCPPVGCGLWVVGFLCVPVLSSARCPPEPRAHVLGPGAALCCRVGEGRSELWGGAGVGEGLFSMG